MAMKFPKPSLVLWNGYALTDHNRGGLDVSVERIEKSSRMANGTMRKYVIADKRSFDTSWEMLPGKAHQTVDGRWGADEIEDFYNKNRGGFTLTLNYGAQPPVEYTVVLTSFSKTLQKRGLYDMYSLSVTMEEV